MTVTVKFRCGHTLHVKREDIHTVGAGCPQCGERVIAHVIGATPRFSGACTGPLVQKNGG